MYTYISHIQIRIRIYPDLWTKKPVVTHFKVRYSCTGIQNFSTSSISNSIYSKIGADFQQFYNPQYPRYYSNYTGLGRARSPFQVMCTHLRGYEGASLKLVLTRVIARTIASNKKYN